MNLEAGTCNIIITGDSLILKGNKTWTIHSAMSCLSRDVIYIIICSKCQDYYIGQTQNLRNRVTPHKEQIKHEQYRHLPVSKHLQRCNNGMFRIMPIYHVRTIIGMKGSLKKVTLYQSLNQSLMHVIKHRS